MYMHACMHICIYICMFVCVYMFTNRCLDVCVYIYIYIYMLAGVHGHKQGYIYNSSILDIEHSPYHIALGSTQTHKVI